MPTLLDWFATHARPLPWRSDPTVWGVLVSEVMLQQTPVERVRPVWESWMRRWPTPSSLAASSPAEVLRAWGRLGYPRRALRLHEAAVVIRDQYAGAVPDDSESLRALPGVGEYTAAAVLSFGHRRPAVVLDVNIRRFFARYFDGRASAAAHVTSAERAFAAALLPEGHEPQWAAASMEFGQMICTAKRPKCDICPVARTCAWLAAGRPDAGERTTRPQAYYGTDRYVRGLVLDRLRRGPAQRAELVDLWSDHLQLGRAIDSLVADGLVDPLADDVLGLPGDAP